MDGRDDYKARDGVFRVLWRREGERRVVVRAGYADLGPYNRRLPAETTGTVSRAVFEKPSMRRPRWVRRTVTDASTDIDPRRQNHDSSPEIVVGKPCIRGLRITVCDMLG